LSDTVWLRQDGDCNLLQGGGSEGQQARIEAAAEAAAAAASRRREETREKTRERRDENWPVDAHTTGDNKGKNMPEDCRNLVQTI
jgi:hypothetical protein